MKLKNDIPRKTIDFEDDIVIVYDDESGHEIYKGIEDFDPMKDENWKWDGSTQSYSLVAEGRKYIKICLDV